MSSTRERNDRSRPEKPGGKEPRHGRFSRGPHGRGEGRVRTPAADGEWLWGTHAVLAALSNPRRTGLRRVLASDSRAPALQAASAGRDVRVEIVEGGEIARFLPPGAVHQGAALLGDPLESLPLEALADLGSGLLLMLDQVTDPQNVGAIFRSAAALGAQGMILQDRHAPALSGVLAKAAAGAVDRLPHTRIVNLSRALEQLSEMGWRTIGLDGDAKESLEAVLDKQPTVLVLGSEGEGLRRLVADHCDVLGRIPMTGGFDSLNVSAAAAIALYAAQRIRL